MGKYVRPSTRFNSETAACYLIKFGIQGLYEICWCIPFRFESVQYSIYFT
jgi:hypothetical protein